MRVNAKLLSLSSKACVPARKGRSFIQGIFCKIQALQGFAGRLMLVGWPKSAAHAIPSSCWLAGGNAHSCSLRWRAGLLTAHLMLHAASRKLRGCAFVNSRRCMAAWCQHSRRAGAMGRSLNATSRQERAAGVGIGRQLDMLPSIDHWVVALDQNGVGLQGRKAVCRRVEVGG